MPEGPWSRRVCCLLLPESIMKMCVTEVLAIYLFHLEIFD